jgi:hypothetical protein
VDNNNSSTDIDFPPLPEYRAQWLPLRYEPIHGGGESLTVALAALGDDGAVRVMQAFSPRQMRCLFGEAADGIADLANMVQSSLEEHLRREQTIEGWRSPMAGFTADRPHTALAHSMDEVIVLGAMETSFLSAANPNLRDLDNPDDVTPEEQSWANQIIDATVAMAPGLKQAFGRTFSVREGMRKTRIDFYGSRLVAGFGRVQPTNVSYYAQRARSKLWQMRVLRDYIRQNELLEIPFVDLLLSAPTNYGSDRDRKAVEETISLIEAEADMEEIRLLWFTEAEAAAEHIIKREAA